jgi:hypothetical protein
MNFQNTKKAGKNMGIVNLIVLVKLNLIINIKSLIIIKSEYEKKNK